MTFITYIRRLIHKLRDDIDKIIHHRHVIGLPEELYAQLSYGSKMYITFKAKVMHLFDPKTEKNLIYG